MQIKSEINSTLRYLLWNVVLLRIIQIILTWALFLPCCVNGYNALGHSQLWLHSHSESHHLLFSDIAGDKMASSFLMNTINTPSDITLPNLIHSNDLTANNPPHDSHHMTENRKPTQWLDTLDLVDSFINKVQTLSNQMKQVFCLRSWRVWELIYNIEWE
jgi:hypothetical protein